MLLVKITENTMKPIINSISIIQNELTFMNTWVNNLSGEESDAVNDMIRPLYPFSEEIGDLRMSVAGWKENVSYLYDKHLGEIKEDQKIIEAKEEVATASENEITHYLILFACLELKMSPIEAAKWENELMKEGGLRISLHEEDFYLWYYNTYFNKVA